MRLALAFEKEGLPKGWSLLPFGNIKPSTERFDPTKEENRRYVGLEHIGKNTGKIIGSQESKMAVSSKTVFCRGDLLYGKLRPYLNKVAVANFDGVCSTDILVFQQNSFIVNTFLKLCLFKSDFVEFANSTVTGVQHPRTSHKKLSDYPIPLPPLSEQHRIVSKIESIFAQIDAAKQQLERLASQVASSSGSLAQLKNSVLKQAFEGRLVSQDPNDEPAEILLRRIHKNLQITTGKNSLPRGWITFQYSKYLQLDYGKSLDKKHRNSNGKFPLYGSSGVIDFSNNFLVKNPCLIIGRKGTAGKIYLVTTPSWPIDTTYYLVDFPMYEQKFLYFLLKQMNLSKLDSSTAIPSLRREDVYSLSMILPPMVEQKHIVAKIESIFGNIDTLNLFCFILRGNLFTNIGYFMILYMQHVISEQ